MKRYPIKWIFLFLSTVVASAPASANAIDSLQTIEQVNAFVSRIQPELRGYDVLDASLKHVDITGISKNRFFKLDLDLNGTTDLLIDGKGLIAVTDAGNDQFTILFIEANHGRGYELKAVSTVPFPLLVVKSRYNRDWPVSGDTLILKYGDFIEYNAHPDTRDIDMVRFSTSYDSDKMPVFSIEIHADRSGFFDAIAYNIQNSTGKFKATIDTTSFNRILQTLRYMKLETMHDHYEVGWSEEQVATLEVRFRNGQVKKVMDEGIRGTFGMLSLYKQFLGLTVSQPWK